MRVDPHGVTATLKMLSPVWWWLRKNFTFPAVCVIAVVIMSAGSYIIHLNTKVVVMERVIMPMVKSVPELARLDERVSAMEKRWAVVDFQGQLPMMPMRPQVFPPKDKADSSREKVD